MTDISMHWASNQCEFYRKLDELLLRHDLKYMSHPEKALVDFKSWLRDNYEEGMTPEEAMEKWVEWHTDHADEGPTMLKGYSPILTEEIEQKYCNIVKRTCKELGLTYKELGERIGYSEGALKTAVSTGKVSEPLKRAIELYLETVELKKDLEKFQQFKELIRSIK